MKRVKTWYQRRKPVIKRVWFEAWRPLIGGAFWGGLAVWSYQGKSILDSFAAGFTAFFFLFFLQGQVLRIAKNVRDEENANELFNRFDNLQEAVEALAAQRGQVYPPTVTQGPPPTTPTTASLLKEAKQALQQHLLYPAVLAAAVAYEKAVRHTAESYEVDSQRPLELLLREFRNVVRDREASDRLQILLRLRNTVVHPDDRGAQLTEQAAAEIVRDFEEGIATLKRIADDSPYL
jgi:hypothetical protein